MYVGEVFEAVKAPNFARFCPRFPNVD